MRWFPKVVLTVVVVGTCISALGAWHPWRTGEPRPYMAAQVQLSSFAQAIYMHVRIEGKLPETLAQLTLPNRHGPDPLMRRIPLDPWGSAYDYRVLAGQRFELRCWGEDGLPDTEDDLIYPQENGR